LVLLRYGLVHIPGLEISSLWDLLLLCRLSLDQDLLNLRCVCISSYQDDGINQPTPLRHTQASNTTSSGPTSSQKRKRSAVDDELPDRPPEEVESAKYGNFDFKEVLDEDLLKRKSSVINRAPVITAWAVIVAERLGFEREEALSIGKRGSRARVVLADANFT
jgi:hypothetical protein